MSIHLSAKDEAIRDEAAAWLARLQSDLVSVEDEAAFRRWLADNADNRAAFGRLAGKWQDAAALADAPEILAARREALDAGQQIAAQRINGHAAKYAASHAGTRFLRRTMSPKLAIAASIALLVIGSFAALQWLQDPGAYRTAIGERQIVTLADGTILTLNTDTSLRVDFTPDARAVVLETGQAYFAVARDPARPFTVFAGDGSVTALGTAFDVRRVGAGAVVTLIEGSIRVKQLSAASPGQATPLALPGDLAKEITIVVEPAENPGASISRQIEYNESGLSEVRLASVEVAIAWQEGKLIFDDWALADALAEVNRYSTQKVSIGDATLNDIRISGVFRTGRSDIVVRALEAYFPIRAVVDGAGDIRLVPLAPPVSPPVSGQKPEQFTPPD